MALEFNYHQEIIDVLAPQTEIDGQDLINAIRAAEYDSIGMAYYKIADATGKDDLGGGIQTGITIRLLPNWQIRFWAGNYTARIYGANVVGGPNDNPIYPVPGVSVILVQSASATLIGADPIRGFLTQQQHDKLLTGLDVSIPQEVWDELLAGHQTPGSAGRELTIARRRAALAALKK